MCDTTRVWILFYLTFYLAMIINLSVDKHKPEFRKVVNSGIFVWDANNLLTNKTVNSIASKRFGRDFNYWVVIIISFLWDSSNYCLWSTPIVYKRQYESKTRLTFFSTNCYPSDRWNKNYFGILFFFSSRKYVVKNIWPMCSI